MRLHNFAHHLLTLCRHVDEGIQAPHEERNAIGFKLPLDQRARASQLLRNISDGSADMRQCNLNDRSAKRRSGNLMIGWERLLPFDVG